MFGYRRRPFFPGALVFIAAGFVLASLIGGAGSAAGAILFLPLLALKLMFVFFVFGMLMRFVGGGWGRGGPGSFGRHHRRPVQRREPTEEEREWARARRDAREEVDELFPDPREW